MESRGQVNTATLAFSTFVMSPSTCRLKTMPWMTSLWSRPQPKILHTRTLSVLNDSLAGRIDTENTMHIIAGMRTDSKEKLWNLVGSEGTPPPSRKYHHQMIKIYAIWWNSEVIFMEINPTFFVCSATDGTSSVTTRQKPIQFMSSNNWSPQQAPSNSSAHSPLVTAKLKVRSCNIWNQDLLHHKTAHRCFPSFIFS